MNCPECGKPATATSTHSFPAYKRRYHRCKAGHRFSTVELPADPKSITMLSQVYDGESLLKIQTQLHSAKRAIAQAEKHQKALILALSVTAYGP